MMIEDKDFQKALDTLAKDFESVAEEAWNLNIENVPENVMTEIR